MSTRNPSEPEWGLENFEHKSFALTLLRLGLGVISIVLLAIGIQRRFPYLILPFIITQVFQHFPAIHSLSNCKFDEENAHKVFKSNHLLGRSMFLAWHSLRLYQFIDSWWNKHTVLVRRLRGLR